MVTDSEYSETTGGYIPPESCAGWSWKVRAKNNASVWSDWSPANSFDVETQSKTVTLKPVFAENGYILRDGTVFPQIVNKYIIAGDFANNLSVQGFMSFDISSIPSGATITDVTVNFSNYYVVNGDPFNDLGCLRVYVQDYGTLDSGDYFGGQPLGAILRYCNAGQIIAESDPDALTALQAKVGSSRFQLRLQFNETMTDNNSDDDYIAWKTMPNEPELIVTYILPD